MDGLLERNFMLEKPGVGRFAIDSKSAERNVYEWAEMMVAMGGRSCVVAQLTKLSDAEVRGIYQRVLGRSSPSGQQPTDLNWYLRSPIRRLHSALLVVLYAQCKHMPPYAAFANAYYHYARTTAASVERQKWTRDPAFRTSEKDYVIPFSRGYFLVSMYSDETDAYGKRLCELQMRRCKKCGGLYMSHITEASTLCPVCE